MSWLDWTMDLSRLKLKLLHIHVEDQWKCGLAAFLIALFIRAVPEVLAGPYPIGLDTLRYVRAIVEGWALQLDPLEVLRSTRLFYVMATAIPGFSGGDTFFFVEFFGH